MYTDKKSILQLASLLRSFGIKRIVLCPGSRNIPIVQTFANIPDSTCYPMTDERSAGFFALGLALHGGTPVAVCCTSGTALLNLHPAVAEAFYQQVPLVIISADRPAAWIGQMDGQTLPQPGVFGTLVKKSVNLPEVTNEESEWFCNRLINEALLELNHHGKGPVHINVPISEPFFLLPEKELPSARFKSRNNMGDSY
jgi:2-succinyl-5-enolpyruvyl-6-hydroxy-3-cyclohexene-1-carboxylate synthase